MPLTDEDLAETLALEALPTGILAKRRRAAQESMDFAFMNFSAYPNEKNLTQLQRATLIYRHLVAIVLPQEHIQR